MQRSSKTAELRKQTRRTDKTNRIKTQKAKGSNQGHKDGREGKGITDGQKHKIRRALCNSAF